MLFVGLQFVIWSVSGAYMVIFDIDYIHGDSLVKNEQIHLKSGQIQYSIATLYDDYPKATQVELSSLLGKAVYRFNTDNKKYLLSADTGKPIAPINENLAARIAKYHYVQVKSTIKRIHLITENPPFELSARHLPVWRIDFDDFASPSFYISENTGQLVTQRHNFWRLFDWMFSFHVMDYIEEDATNKLLLVFIVFSLIACLFGLVLTYFSLIKRDSNSRKRVRKNA